MNVGQARDTPCPITMAHTLFVSDLHLSAARPHITHLFEQFLREQAPKAEAVFILGDLFDYWAGDDDLADPFHTRLARLLFDVASQIPLHVMHGNRDFLLGNRFMRETGARPLPDPTVIDLYGIPTLLMHGDTLCTDDLAYQRFRAQVRDPRWQAEFLAQPLARRKAQIEALRNQSEVEKSGKPADIMDVNPSAVLDALREHSATRLIHGHTHRPGRHSHHLDGQTCERFVLPDWYERGGYLSCDRDGCTLHFFDTQAAQHSPHTASSPADSRGEEGSTMTTSLEPGDPRPTGASEKNP